MSRQKPIIKSTGILMNEDRAATELHVFVANLDPTHDRHVKVEVFDWEGLTPIPVTLTSENGPQEIPDGGGPIEIEENSAAEFEASIANTLEYEVRVTFFHTDKNVVVMSQGVGPNDNNVIGQQVLNKDFTKVSID